MKSVIVEEKIFYREELDINMGEIFAKLRCVILPIPSRTLQRAAMLRDNPDFWGPVRLRRIADEIDHCTFLSYSSFSVLLYSQSMDNFELFHGLLLFGSLVHSVFSS